MRSGGRRWRASGWRLGGGPVLVSCLGLAALLATGTPPTRPAGAQDAVPRLQLVGQIAGATLAVDLLGRYAYLGVGPRVQAVDLAKPGQPEVAGRTGPFEGVVTSLAAEAGRAVACIRHAGRPDELRLLSLADPARPAEEGRLELASPCQSLALGGGLAYVVLGDTARSLGVVDLADLGHPALAAVLPMTGAADVSARGREVFVAANDLVVIRVADPTKPSVVGRFDRFGTVVRLDVRGERALLVTVEHGLYLVDVAQPNHPDPVGHTDLDGLGPVAVGDSHAVVARYERASVYTLPDAGRPEALAGLEDVNEVTAVAADGELGVAVDRRGDLHVLGLGESRPFGPLASLSTGGPSRQVAALNGGAASTAVLPYNPQIENNDFRASRGGDVWLLQSPGRAEPVLAGSFRTRTDVQDLRSDGLVALVSDGGGGLAVVGRPGADPPRVMGKRELGPALADVAMDAGYAFVPIFATEGSSVTIRLSVLDVAHPPGMAELGGAKVLDVPQGRGRTTNPTALVAASAGVFFLRGDGITTGSTLYVVDVRVPSRPQVLSRIKDFGGGGRQVLAMAADAERLALLTPTTLRLYELRDPAQPAFAGSLGLPTRPRSVAFHDGLAAVAVDSGGLVLVDCTDLAHPRVLQTLPTFGAAYDVSFSGDLLSVADGDGGVLFVRLVQPGVPTPLPTDPPATSPTAPEPPTPSPPTATLTPVAMNPTATAPPQGWQGYLPWLRAGEERQ